VEVKTQQGEYPKLAWGLQAAVATDGTFVGMSQRGSAAIKYQERFEDVSDKLSELSYVEGATPLNSNQVNPIHELVVGFRDGFATTTPFLKT